ncbi:MAG: hypothetical protein ACR2OU_05490 [Thermomicrobiales bacterium]
MPDIDATSSEKLSDLLIAIAEKSPVEALNPIQFGITWQVGESRLTIFGDSAQTFLDALDAASKVLYQHFSESLVRDRMVEALFRARNVSPTE